MPIKQDPTYKPVKEEIEFLWNKWTIDGSIKCLRIENMESIVRSIVDANNKATLEKLDNSLILFDEFLGWFSNLALVAQESDLSDVRNKVCAVICGTLCSHLISIRHLVQTGHDLPAKQILRSFSEHIDIMNLLWLSPELCGPFSKIETADEANTFWHTHVSKGKLKKKTIQLLLGDGALDEATKEWRKYREQEEKILGMAVHPTFLGCTMSFLPAGKSPDISHPGFFGAKSELSIRTLQYAIATTWELLLNTTFPFGNFSENGFDNEGMINADLNNELHASIHVGRHVLMDIIFLLSKWQDNNPYLEAERGNLPYAD